VGFCSASSRTEGVCSEPERRVLDISQERGGFQLRLRCEPKPAPAHVELMSGVLTFKAAIRPLPDQLLAASSGNELQR
jgi:hypothetical protein